MQTARRSLLGEHGEYNRLELLQQNPGDNIPRSDANKIRGEALVEGEEALVLQHAQRRANRCGGRG